MQIKNGFLKNCEECSEMFFCRKDKKDRARFCSRRCLTRFIKRQQDIDRKYKIECESPEETKQKMKESFERFFEKSAQCWVWTGGKKNKLPYGTFSFRDRTLIAHRASYEIYRGIIPERKIILHICDNPPCVNPDHLKLGTHLDNQIDKVSKGRGRVEKLSIDQVKEIKSLLNSGIDSASIGRKFGVSTTNICNIKNKKIWIWV